MSSKDSSFHIIACFAATVLLLLLSAFRCEAQLTPNYYDYTCPQALSTIRAAVGTAITKESRMAASLIRLHFHDCFVQGCDASILLDDAWNIVSEKNAPPNYHSVRGFEVIDGAKSAIEMVCPGVVSCADILAVVARDSSEYVGGPTWTVKLGRRDSTTANKDLALANLPKFSSGLDALVSTFARQGLSVIDMVALSGAHTVGLAQCTTFRDRIYNETDIDPGFASRQRRRCPSAGGDTNRAPLDLVTRNSFDNNYYKNLLQQKGLLHSDQVLFNGGATDDIVRCYSENQAAFYADFAAAMVRMGDISPLTGAAGEIRKMCRLVN